MPTDSDPERETAAHHHQPPHTDTNQLLTDTTQRGSLQTSLVRAAAPAAAHAESRTRTWTQTMCRPGTSWAAGVAQRTRAVPIRPAAGLAESQSNARRRLFFPKPGEGLGGWGRVGLGSPPERAAAAVGGVRGCGQGQQRPSPTGATQPAWTIRVIRSTDHPSHMLDAAETALQLPHLLGSRAALDSCSGGLLAPAPGLVPSCPVQYFSTRRMADIPCPPVPPHQWQLAPAWPPTVVIDIRYLPS
jgi:hypothetical protein